MRHIGEELYLGFENFFLLGCLETLYFAAVLFFRSFVVAADNVYDDRRCEQSIQRQRPPAAPPGRHYFNGHGRFAGPYPAAVTGLYPECISAWRQLGEISLTVGFQVSPGFIQPFHFIGIFCYFRSGIAEQSKVDTEGGLMIAQRDLAGIGNRRLQRRSFCSDRQLAVVYLEARDIYRTGEGILHKFIRVKADESLSAAKVHTAGGIPVSRVEIELIAQQAVCP